ncbi:MAG: PEP/pyruvate-binding domain-containing protein [bacterium]
MNAMLVPLSAPEAADPGRFGPKAANLAALGHAGLPIPEGICLDAAAYRLQLARLGLEEAAREASRGERQQARHATLQVKLGLFQGEIAPEILEPLLAGWRKLVNPPRIPGVVRSSALIEDRPGTSFAGQFESFLGLDSEADFLTAVRSCWAALWSTQALRYMATHGMDPAENAMALLIQPLVAARASGGGLSQTAEGEMILSATWGLGSAIAQGEVVPDRYVLSREGDLRESVPGRKTHRADCGHGAHVGNGGDVGTAVAPALATAPCLDAAQAIELGRLLRGAEAVLGMPAEIEWAMDETGFKLLQARPLPTQAVENARVPDDIWLSHPRLSGHPAGVGWGTGTARVVNCECELSRVAPGDVLVTRVAGPALSQVLPRVAGVVAELGGSTSHLASLARERGIPMVLGVLDATTRIPDGCQVAVDGIVGVVRWMR